MNKKTTLLAATLLLAASAFAQNISQEKPTNDHTPVLKFDSEVFDFDTVAQGTTVQYRFVFKNMGDDPLIISSANTSTGAAVASWPKEPIKKGDQGVISYTFSTAGKMGMQHKSITINSNASQNPFILKAQGYVKPPQEFFSNLISTLKKPAEIKFDSEVYNFDTVVSGKIVEHNFTFTNAGDEPLIVESAITACGCDVASWSKEPILKGQKGIIKYSLMTNGKMGMQSKTVTVKTNSKINPVILQVKGYIVKE